MNHAMFEKQSKLQSLKYLLLTSCTIYRNITKKRDDLDLIEHLKDFTAFWSLIFSYCQAVITKFHLNE